MDQEVIQYLTDPKELLWSSISVDTNYCIEAFESGMSIFLISPVFVNNYEPSLQLISDATVGHSTYRISKFMQKFKPVYQYKFSYVGRYSHLYYPADKPYGEFP